MLAAFLRVLFVLLAFVGPASASSTNPFRVEVKDASVPAGGSGVVTVVVVVPPGHHVYRDKLAVDAVDAAGLTVGPASYPPGRMKPDPAAPDTQREVYEQDVWVEVPVTAPADASGARALRLSVQYQGCKKDLCYFPQEEVVSANVTIGPSAAGDASGDAAPTPTDGGETAVVITGAAGATPGTAVVRFDLQGDWHINRAFVAVTAPADAAGWAVGEVPLPPGEKSGSEADGSAREDYVVDFELVVPITQAPAGARELVLDVAYQACKGAQLCRFPTSELVKIPWGDGAVAAVASATPATQAAAAASAPAASGDVFAAAQSQGLGVLTLVCFLAGIGVSFTPCVLPMVPITMGLIGARNAGNRAVAVSLAATYVAGQALVYTGLAVFAALTGSLFGSWLQSPWLVGAISLFFFTMGASMFGAFELAVPSAITSRISHQGGGGFGGAFVLGTIGAVVAGPCSGPVVAGILALIGQTGQILAGTMLMLAFSLGMGMIFLVTGAASGWLPQRGAWMLTVKKSFGIFMWLGAIWYASAHLPAEVTAGLTVAVLLGTAVFAWPHADDGEGVTVERARILYSIVAGTIGVVVLSGNLLAHGFLMPAPIGLGGGGGGGGAQAEAAGRITWLTDEAEALARAKAEGKPLIIDFTADWCAACHELEAFTFSDATVADAINTGFVPLRIDCTKNDARVAEIQKHYGVTGLPTVVFARGDRSRIDATIGFYNAKDFLPFVERARSDG